MEKRKAYTMFVGNTSSCCTERNKGVKYFKINIKGTFCEDEKRMELAEDRIQRNVG
jgi:hypothetical protein